MKKKEAEKKLKTPEEIAKKIGDKIKKVWKAIKSFDDLDLEDLEMAKSELKKQKTKLTMLEGDRASYQQKLNNLLIKRINALIFLIKNKPGQKDLEIERKYLKEKVK